MQYSFNGEVIVCYIVHQGSDLGQFHVVGFKCKSWATLVGQLLPCVELVNFLEWLSPLKWNANNSFFLCSPESWLQRIWLQWLTCFKNYAFVVKYPALTACSAMSSFSSPMPSMASTIFCPTFSAVKSTVVQPLWPSKMPKNSWKETYRFNQWYWTKLQTP